MGFNQNVTPKEGINSLPSETEKTEDVMIAFTKPELELITSLTKLLSSMADPNGKTIVSENNLVAFIRYCLTYVNAVYQTQVFPDSRIINTFQDKDTKREFIAFRTKYMGIPTDVQLQDLKRLGLVKPKKAKTG